MKSVSVEKVAFILSLLSLAFLYGIATQAFGWFPAPFLKSAWNQMEAVSPLSTGTFAGSRRPQWRSSRIYERQGVRIVRPERMEPGLTLLTSAWGPSGNESPGLRLVDADGNVLHRWEVDPSEVFSDTVASPRGALGLQDIQGTYLFPNGDVLVNVEYVGAARLDACGRVRWRRSAHSHHHSIARSDEGTFWVPGVKPESCTVGRCGSECGIMTSTGSGEIHFYALGAFGGPVSGGRWWS